MEARAARADFKANEARERLEQIRKEEKEEFEEVGRRKVARGWGEAETGRRLALSIGPFETGCQSAV